MGLSGFDPSRMGGAVPAIVTIKVKIGTHFCQKGLQAFAIGDLYQKVRLKRLRLDFDVRMALWVYWYQKK